MPSLLMVVGVVAVSFLKPMAFSRYFVVLLPALVPVLAVQIGAVELNRFGRLWIGCAESDVDQLVGAGVCRT